MNVERMLGLVVAVFLVLILVFVLLKVVGAV